MVITSKQNPTVKYFSQLSEKKFRREYSAFLVEGVKSVNEAFKSPLKVLSVICTPSLAEDYPQATVVSEQVFGSVSAEKTPQGVMAALEMPKMELSDPESSCIFLDGLQDPGNVGTIIRTANAAGYEEIYLADCADPFSPKAVRASMSGVFFTKIYQGTRTEVLSALSEVPKIVADMDGKDIFSFNPPAKFCLCIGNEGNGVSSEVKNSAAHTVKIPMRDTCESLNAAVSAGIAMYALKNHKENK